MQDTEAQDEDERSQNLHPDLYEQYDISEDIDKELLNLLKKNAHRRKSKSLETQKILRSTNHCVVNLRYSLPERKKNLLIHSKTRSFKTLNDSGLS